MPDCVLMQKTPGLTSVGIQGDSHLNKNPTISKAPFLTSYKTTFTVLQDATDERPSLELEWSLVYFPWNGCQCRMIKCHFCLRTCDLGGALVPLRQRPPLLFLLRVHPRKTNQSSSFSKVTPTGAPIQSTRLYSAPSFRFYWDVWQYE